jgi:hypothetical protein
MVTGGIVAECYFDCNARQRQVALPDRNWNANNAEVRPYESKKYKDNAETLRTQRCRREERA